MNSIRSRLLAGMLAAMALFGVGASARAAEFVYVAPCLVQCAAIGLADNALVAATLTIDDGAIVPNGAIGIGSIQSFALAAGGLTFTLPNLVAFAALLDATGTYATQFIFAAQTATDAFIASNDGTTNLFLAVAGQLSAVGGPGVLVRRVPEPATALLLVGGLLAAGALRRRKG